MYLPSPTAVRECLITLLDGGWHDLYELHERYRLSPVEVHDVLQFLFSYELIERNSASIKLTSELSNYKFSLLNSLLKTQRPVKLTDAYYGA